MQPAADRNLLFGILAVQMDFITRDQLVAAMHAWVMDKAKPLGAILVEQKALSSERHTLLDALVMEHLKQHDNDPHKSLAAVSSVSSVRNDLAQVADAEVQASLVQLGAADPYATRSPSVGTPTSDGLRFRILRPHAKGGLGEVFVAHDEELHREVALKEIQDRHADNQDSRTRFLLEAEITGGLEHPGIVPVYGLGQYADGRPFYAMRFIGGDNLKEAIEQHHRCKPGASASGERRLELRKLLGRLIDVCNAIQYAHDRGVLHRDLKPGNIMLGKYGETLVVDWGLAKAAGKFGEPGASTAGDEPALRPASASGSAETVVGSAIGTPAYMSPEQAAGRLDLLGPVSDVYSLGATLYTILTGKPPVEDKDAGAVLQKVQRGDIPRPRQANADVPAALEAICLKAMAVKGADRCSNECGTAATSAAIALLTDVPRRFLLAGIAATYYASVLRGTGSMRWIGMSCPAQMFRAFSDVQTAEMLNLPRPRLDTGKPIVVACHGHSRPDLANLWRALACIGGFFGHFPRRLSIFT